MLGIDELSALGLRESRFDLRSNSPLAGQHPIFFRILLANDGEGLIENLFWAYA